MRNRIIFLLFSILLLFSHTIFAATGVTVEKKIPESIIVWITGGTTGKQKLDDKVSKIFLPSSTGKRVVYVQTINPKNNQPDKVYKTKEYDHPHVLTIQKGKTGEYLYDMTTYYFGKSDNAGLEKLKEITQQEAQKLGVITGVAMANGPRQESLAIAPKTGVQKKELPKLPDPPTLKLRRAGPKKVEKKEEQKKELPKFEPRPKGSVENSYNILKLAVVPSPSNVKAAFVAVSNEWLPDKFKNKRPEEQNKAKLELEKINAAYKEFNQIFAELKIFGLKEAPTEEDILKLGLELSARLEQDQSALAKLGKLYGSSSLKKIENFENTQEYQEIKSKQDRLFSTSYPKLIEYAKLVAKIKYKK